MILTKGDSNLIASILAKILISAFRKEIGRYELFVLDISQASIEV